MRNYRTYFETSYPLIVLIILAGILWPVLPSSAQVSQPQVNARAEVAAALYAASATQAAAERAADETIRTQRAQIEALGKQGNETTGESPQLRHQLTAAEEAYGAALAEKDRAYV
ncbi:MAG: hypothetical protein AB8G77_20075, partial [Rhodothermales bacterium]